MNTKKQINLILVYINPKSDSVSKIIRRNFFTAIGQLKEQLYINMVVGDFNHVDRMYDKPINIKQNYDKQTSEIWEDIEIDNKWTDPFREKYTKKRIYSFESRDKKRRSRIDKIYIDEDNWPNVTEYKYLETPFFYHKVMQINIIGEIDHYWRDRSTPKP